jgi:hypothetical protein
MASKQRLDVSLDIVRLRRRSVSLDYLAILANQELGEVPVA